MTKYEFCIESVNDKFDNGEITLEQYLSLTQMINEEVTDEDIKKLKTSDTLGLVAGVTAGALVKSTMDYKRGDAKLGNYIASLAASIGAFISVRAIAKAVNSSRYNKIHKDLKLTSPLLLPLYRTGVQFNELTHNTYKVNEFVQVRTWEIDHVPLAFATSFDNYDPYAANKIKASDIKYKIFDNKLKGGLFEKELKLTTDKNTQELIKNKKKLKG